MVYQQILYILKRLALGVPALLIITSIVFLLSKAMPGNSGTYLLEQDGGGIGSLADGVEREKTFRTYLQRTGQDKPLFYFSLSSRAEPDTLNKILHDNQRHFLKQLCFEYGDWQYVYGYYQALKQLQLGVEQLHRVSRLQPVVEQLFTAVSEAEIKERLYRFTLIAKENGTDLNASVRLVQRSFEQMRENRKPYSKLVPVFLWNGNDNQYHAWLEGLLKGNMGFSLKGYRPVSTVIGEAIGVTLIMSITALCIGWAALRDGGRCGRAAVCGGSGGVYSPGNGRCVSHRGCRLSGNAPSGFEPAGGSGSLRDQGERRRECGDHAVLL